MSLSQADSGFLQRAIDISRDALDHQGKTPFGALVVVDGEIMGEGTSSVIELTDLTAHAEVMTLRNAGAKLRRHLFEDGAGDTPRAEAVAVLRSWADRLPATVAPKLLPGIRWLATCLRGTPRIEAEERVGRPRNQADRDREP